MTGSKALDVSFLWAWVRPAAVPTAYLGPGRLADRTTFTTSGRPTGIAAATGRLHFSRQAVSHPADANVHCFCCSGARKPGRFCALGAAAVALLISWRCTGAFSLIGFMLRQFEIARWWGIPPYNADCFSARSRCS